MQIPEKYTPFLKFCMYTGICWTATFSSVSINKFVPVFMPHIVTILVGGERSIAPYIFNLSTQWKFVGTFTCLALHLGKEGFTLWIGGWSNTRTSQKVTMRRIPVPVRNRIQIMLSFGLLKFIPHVAILTYWVKLSPHKTGHPPRVPGGWSSQISRKSTYESGKVVSPMHRPPLLQTIPVVLISVRVWVDPRTIVRQKG